MKSNPRSLLTPLRDLLEKHRNRPLTLREICARLEARGADRTRVRKALIQLRREGVVARLHNRKLVLADSPHAQRQLPSSRPHKGSRKYEPRRIPLKSTVVGEYGIDPRRRPYLLPIRKGIRKPVRLLGCDVHTAEAGRIAVATYVGDTADEGSLTAKFERWIGTIDDPTIDSNIVIARNELPETFPQQVLREAEEVAGRATRAGKEERIDLREISFVTIDGADARDHDDAIAIDPAGNLWVAIADVGSFVETESELDREAAQRGNSYYFPDRVLPMFPERLSTDLCSLVPDKDRLVLAVRFRVDGSGMIVSPHLCSGTIRSRARLTYDGVDAMLESPNAQEIKPELRPMIEALKRVAMLLHERRREEGGIDFELRESRVVLGAEGVVKAMVFRGRTPAQQIVEELMLAANRIVAQELEREGYPLAYRVHPEPDPRKLLDYLRIAEAHGFSPNFSSERIDPKELERFLESIRKDPRGEIFSSLALRAMPQAYYHTENVGHFGLGFTHYVHFTSPIRRYADLVVHRSFRRFLERRPPAPRDLFPKAYSSLETLCTHISQTERTAQVSEREIVLLKGIRFMESRGKETFDAHVSGMIPRGIFLALKAHAVEGFLPLRWLRDDHYIFSEQELIFQGMRRGRTIRMGDRFRVRVDKTSIPNMRLDFALA